MAAAANLQVEQMKLGAAGGEWPMRLGTMLPRGRILESLPAVSQGWISASRRRETAGMGSSFENDVLPGSPGLPTRLQSDAHAGSNPVTALTRCGQTTYTGEPAIRRQHQHMGLHTMRSFKGL